MNDVNQKLGDVNSSPIIVTQIPKTLLNEIQLFVDETFSKENLELEYGTCTRQGKQTGNIVRFPEIKNILKNIYQLISDLTSENEKPFYIHHVHAINYSTHGLQAPHTHDHVENFSFIINLDNSNARTMFSINNVHESVLSEEGKMILFSADILHWATPTDTQRRVLVGGCKIGIE